MKPTYHTLFKTSLLISCLCFGGGYVIIPFMKKYFVETYKFMNEEELLDIYAIAQTAPGAIAVNSAVLIGYKLKGKTGAFISALGTILPPFFVILLVAHFYSNFQNNIYFTKILTGMSVGVAILMVDFLISMIQIITKEKSFYLLFLALLCFLAAEFTNINIALIIIVAAVISFFKYIIKDKIKSVKGGGPDDRN